METFSALLALCAGNSPVPGEFPAQRPATRSFDVFFDLRLNKRFSTQSGDWWFETLSCPLWRHCNVLWKLKDYRSGFAQKYMPFPLNLILFVWVILYLFTSHARCLTAPINFMFSWRETWKPVRKLYFTRLLLAEASDSSTCDLRWCLVICQWIGF